MPPATRTATLLDFHAAQWECCLDYQHQPAAEAEAETEAETEAGLELEI